MLVSGTFELNVRSRVVAIFIAKAIGDFMFEISRIHALFTCPTSLNR